MSALLDDIINLAIDGKASLKKMPVILGGADAWFPRIRCRHPPVTAVRVNVRNLNACSIAVRITLPTTSQF
jgi:hypothetical protein